MANWSNITPENSNEKDDEFIILHQGINRLQKRDVVAASMSNARWIAEGNYLAGSEVQGSDNLWYTAVVNTGSDYGNSINPVSRTDNTIWKHKYDMGYQLSLIPIGMELAFDTPPPTDDLRFRFVKLTADDPYNGDLLINKVISGTAPNLVVRMTVNSALSTINGQQISMLNTMGAIPTPGVTSGVIVQDAIRNIKASMGSGRLLDSATCQFSGAFAQTTRLSEQVAGPSSLTMTGFDFDASRVVPTSDRVQVFAETKVYYKRIY